MAAGTVYSALRRQLGAPRAAAHIWREIGCGALLALLCGLLPLLIGLGAWSPPAPLAIDPVQPAAGVQLGQIYGVERNADGPFVWTMPQARIAASVAIDGPYEVAIVAQDSPLSPTQRTLRVYLDGDLAGEVTLSPTPQTYHFHHDTPRGSWQNARTPLRIDLATMPLSSPGDSRALGFILRGATIRPLAPPPAWGLWAALMPGLLAVGLYALARVLGARSPVATAGVALGTAATWGLLLIQQPRLALWLGAALACQPLLAFLPAACAGALATLVAARPRRAARAVLVAIAALPAAIQVGVLARLIWLDPIQVPWYDELFNFSFLFAARLGHFSWADLWQPYGGIHRTVLPRLVYAAAIGLTNWDRRVWLTINPALIGVACAFLTATIRRTLAPRGLAAVVAAIAGGLLFALSQYGHWLLPFGLQFGLVVCLGTLALWALGAGRLGWPQVALAIGAAWLASWSSLQGLALWIALLPLVATAGWRKVAVWLACGIAVIGTYARGLPAATMRPQEPFGVLGYTLASLGAPLGTLQPLTARSQFWSHLDIHLDRRWALLFGVGSLALLACNLAVLWRRRRAEPAMLARALPWCCLALFALGCAALTALGRATDQAESALTSRYQTFALLWWVALLVIGAQATVASRQAVPGRPSAVAALNLLALAGGAICFAQVTLVSGYLAGDLHGQLRQAETCARDLDRAPDYCLEPLHVPAVARLRLAQLADARLALYRTGTIPPVHPAANPATVPDPPRLRRLPFTTLYAIDGLPGPLSAVDGQPPPLTVAETQPITLRGWALDVASVPPRPALGVYLALDDATPIWVPIGEAHPVPAVRFSASLGNAGFHLTLPPGTLTPGRHTLRVTVATADGEAEYEESPPLVFTVE